MRYLQYDVFVGCYGRAKDDTIHWLTFDSENGKLCQQRSFSGVDNPSFLSIYKEKNCLYAISEVDDGEVVSFAIDQQNQHIYELNRQAAKGGPCLIEVSDGGDHVLTANYGGGSLIVHKLTHRGSILKETDFKDYNASGSSHIHTIRHIPGTPYYIAADLGLDRLYVYTFDRQTSQLMPQQTVDVPQNSGPRHIAFHPHGNVLYVVSEFRSTILVYAYDDAMTNMHLLQELSTLPRDFRQENYGADIHVTPSGKYVYVSNRGHHSITGYKVLANGKLAIIGYTSTQGKWPRNFTITPDEKYLIVANEQSNHIVVMKILHDGHLQYTQHQFNLNKPVCLQVMPV